MKNENGVTLIVLVITTIVLTIIAGIGIVASTGMKGSIQTAKNNLEVAELSQIQEAVLEAYTKYEQTQNTNYLKGVKISYSIAETELNSIDSSLYLRASESSDSDKSYYLLDPDDLSELGIQGAEDSYIVNYSTGEVFNITTRVTAQNEILYVYAK